MARNGKKQTAKSIETLTHDEAKRRTFRRLSSSQCWIRSSRTRGKSSILATETSTRNLSGTAKMRRTGAT
jgi:hypothetical protein